MSREAGRRLVPAITFVRECLQGDEVEVTMIIARTSDADLRALAPELSCRQSAKRSRASSRGVRGRTRDRLRRHAPWLPGLDRWATREKFEEITPGVSTSCRCRLPRACSGLMYTGVPITWPSSVRNGLRVPVVGAGLRDTEVDDLRQRAALAFRDEDVRWLQVADDPALMGAVPRRRAPGRARIGLECSGTCGRSSW